MAQQYTEIESLDWFHPNITRHTAESLLLQNGRDGTYLLRSSSKGSGEYALSVKFEQSVKHFNIVWNGTNIAFGHGTFRTIEDFVEHFKNKPLIGTESSQLVLLKCGRSKATAIIKEMAEQTKTSLQERMKTGSFTVSTDGSNDADGKQFPLVIRTVNTATGLVMSELLGVPVLNGYATGENIFNLIDAEFKERAIPWENCLSLGCDNYNIMTGWKKGVLTFVKGKQEKVAYPRNVEEPNMYESVTVHAEFSTAEEPTDNINFSLNTKEGYLTKLGRHFKTWKTRWFVLRRNELMYYKEKFSKDPIRVLDLRECTECREDATTYRDKTNIFKLVFKWRTFYMYATTPQDMTEWVKRINWCLTENKRRR